MRPKALPKSLGETTANSVAPSAGEDHRAMFVAQASDENLNQWVAVGSRNIRACGHR